MQYTRFKQSILNFIITILLILLQFAWIVYLIYWASTEFQYVNAVISFIAIIVSLYVASRNIRTSHKLSWVFLMLALPIVGVPAYYMFGRPELTRKRRKQMAAVLANSAPYRQSDEALVTAIKRENVDAYLQSQYIANYGGYPLHREETTKYYNSGEAMMDDFLEDLRGAKKFIFIEFFIIGIGQMWGQVLEILEQKVKEGVEVRVIFDDFGSRQVLKGKYDKDLEAKGIHAIRFNPFRPFLMVVMNNRDHRKIVVVDNKVAYTGGVNLSDEYINKVERFGYWKDAAVRITGNPCTNFTLMFLEMWNYARGEQLDYLGYIENTNGPELQSPIAGSGKGYVQPYGDSPLDREYVGENVYINMISRAHRYVYIATPYLIIGSELSGALMNAAKSGVDVRIVVPGIPDKKLTYQLTKSNFRALINGGVKIYTYTPGFIHTKCFVVDGEYAAIGSVNLDYRSLTLHFECGSFHYKTEAVRGVEMDLRETIQLSREVSLDECENKSVIKRTVLMILKLFSPMM